MPFKDILQSQGPRLCYGLLCFELRSQRAEFGPSQQSFVTNIYMRTIVLQRSRSHQDRKGILSRPIAIVEEISIFGCCIDVPSGAAADTSDKLDVAVFENLEQASQRFERAHEPIQMRTDNGSSKMGLTSLVMLSVCMCKQILMTISRYRQLFASHVER